MSLSNAAWRQRVLTDSQPAPVHRAHVWVLLRGRRYQCSVCGAVLERDKSGKVVLFATDGELT